MAERVLHPCEVVTYEGRSSTTCGKPGTLWTAPGGNTYKVCPEHQASFEANLGARPINGGVTS